MKKFLLIGLLLLGLTLTGCIQKMDQDDLFEKKQECAKHRSEIEKIAKEKYGDVGYDFIEEIFYSPKLNSCLYTINEFRTG